MDNDLKISTPAIKILKFINDVTALSKECSQPDETGSQEEIDRKSSMGVSDTTPAATALAPSPTDQSAASIPQAISSKIFSINPSDSTLRETETSQIVAQAGEKSTPVFISY